MSLCNQIEEDISIFLDLDDMATVHIIRLPGDTQTREITVVVDDDELQRNSLKSSNGVYDGDLLFFARSEDVEGVVPDSFVQFDKVPYQVSSAVDSDGMKQITLRAGRGGF